jgi:uncharacterized membrane protein (DUF2068 family)
VGTGATNSAVAPVLATTGAPTGAPAGADGSGPPRRVRSSDVSSRRWHPETFVCSLRGHVTPAAWVRTLRSEDSGVGVELADGRRLARCLRCDSWVAVCPDDHDGPETLPDLDASRVPRRGKRLREAVVLRLIAIERAVHSVLFGIIAVGAVAIEVRLPLFRATVQRWLGAVDQMAGTTGAASTGTFLDRQLRHLLTLRSGSLRMVAATAAVYCVLEGVEAVGLWKGRRWAEYLTALATAGFLPFEILELTKRVTVVRAGALVVNVAILVYLVWQKRLFGIGRLWAGKREEALDLEALFGPASLGTPFLRETS